MRPKIVVGGDNIVQACDDELLVDEDNIVQGCQNELLVVDEESIRQVCEEGSLADEDKIVQPCENELPVAVDEGNSIQLSDDGRLVVDEDNIVHVSTNELLPFLSHASHYEILQMPGSNVVLRQGQKITYQKDGMLDRRWVESLLIQSRSGKTRPECERCEEDLGVYRDCVILEGYWHNGCGNCKRKKSRQLLHDSRHAQSTSSSAARGAKVTDDN